MTDDLRPNQFPVELKLRWLNDLDHKIFLELHKSHEGFADKSFEEYEDIGSKLLVPLPFATELYGFYLQSCMDRENGETGRYNQSAALYNAALDSYRAHCLQTMTAKSAGPFKLKGDAPCPLSPF